MAWGLLANGLGLAAAGAPPRCANTGRLASSKPAAIMWNDPQSFIGGSPLSGRRVGKRECEYICVGPDGNVLLPVDAVGHRASCNQSARIEVPQHLAGLRVQRSELTLLLPCEQYPAGSRYDARTVVVRADLHVAPHSLTGSQVERPHVKLPVFLILGTLQVTRTATGGTALKVVA